MNMGIFSSSSSSSKASKRSSISSAASQAPSRLSASSNSSGISYLVQFPFTGTTTRTKSQQGSSSSLGDIAEMLDDDNMAWGKPKKARR